MRKYKGIVAIVAVISVIALSGCGDDGFDMSMMMEEDSGINVEVAYPTVRTISQSGTYYRNNRNRR